MPFNLGPLEMVLVLVVVLLLFGAKRLPELGQGVGRGIREFKRSVSDVSSELQRPAGNAPVARSEAPAALEGRTLPETEPVDAARRLAAPERRSPAS